MSTGGTLESLIRRYNDAWNRHDLDAIMSMHAPDMVFENHTVGGLAEGPAVRDHIARIFENWPDISFSTRRVYVRDDLVVQEWTAAATHVNPIAYGDSVAEPTGRPMEWKGVDVIPVEDGLVKRKDVYSQSALVVRDLGPRDASTSSHAEMLARLAEHLAPIFANSPDGVYVWLDEQHKACSERLAALFGCTVEEWAAAEPFLTNFVAPADRELYLWHYLHRVADLAFPVTFRFRGLRKDGSTFAAETDMIPISFMGHAVAYHFVRRLGE